MADFKLNDDGTIEFTKNKKKKKTTADFSIDDNGKVKVNGVAATQFNQLKQQQQGNKIETARNSLKGGTPTKDNSFLSTLGYVGKEFLTEGFGGLSKIPYAITSEIGSNLDKGEEKSFGKSLLDTWQSVATLSNPTMAITNLGKNIYENAKEQSKTDKSVGNKILGTAFNTITEDNVLDKTTQTIGTLLPDGSGKAVNKAGETVLAPYKSLREDLDKEKAQQGKVGQFAGTVSGVIGNMGPAIAATALTKNPTTGLAMMGLGAKGGATDEALRGGADLETATKYGSVIGATEILTEKITGGLKVFGGGALDDVVLGSTTKKGLVNGIKNDLGKKIAIKGYEYGGEVAEELIADVVGMAAQRGSWNEDAGYTLEDVGETTAVTLMSTLILNILTKGKVGVVNANGTTLDSAEVVNNTIAEAEQELGRPLTDVEKGFVASQVDSINKVTSTPTQSVEQIEAQIENLESQLNENLSDEQYNKITNEIKILEEQAEQIEQNGPTTTQEVETNSLVDAPSNTLNNVNNQESPVIEDISPVKSGQETTINSQVVDNVENKEIDEIKDNTGKTISKENQIKLKDSKVRDDNGNVMRVYHGTNSDFETYDTNFFNTNEKSGDYVGEGFYFTKSKGTASKYGGKVKENYLNMNNPLIINSEEAAKEYRKSFNGLYNPTDPKEIKQQEELRKYIDDYDYFELMKTNPRAIREEVQRRGYDGLIDNLYNQYAVFNPEQIINANDTNTETTNKEITPVKNEINSNIPTKEELDNLENTRQNQSGSEYASAFFDLRDKYGQANLYKGINEYNSNAKNGSVSDETTSKVQEDLAPIKEATKELKTLQKEVSKQVTELKETMADFKAVTQEQLEDFNNQYKESLEQLYEMTAPVKEDTTPDYQYENDNNGSKSKVDSPLEDRDMKEVGSKKVKAYQFEHPEFKPFLQNEAKIMLNDLHNSVKGEKLWTQELNSDTGLYENSLVTGTKRQTTKDIAYLLDNYNYTYADIEKGLNAIIEDNGKENIAVAKRIEILLDERLRNGYESVDGTQIPANSEYQNFLENNNSKNHYSNLSRGIENTEPPIEEIAPVKEINDSEIKTSIPTKSTISEKSNVDWDSVEDTSKGNQITYNTETQALEEDLVKKTKKELRKALLGTEEQKEFITSALDNAKNRSMALMNNTDTIRNTELVFGREAANVINEKIFQKEIDNEADSIKWQNEQRNEIKALGIKARSKESAAVQKYGEKQWVNESGEVVPYGDVELANEFSDTDTQERIKNAAKEIRKKYDDYIDKANEVLTKLGFDPIKKRNDYMRHFQELNDVFSRHGIPFNAQNMAEHTLPTDINGLTEFWSPQKNYFANMQARKGMKTTYDAITGIDGYISGISNLIFHTEDIQRGRAFEELIRETYGEDKGWENLENLPDELQKIRSEKIQDNHLSNYAAWVHEWTNNVAGKKSKVDRSIEATLGRKAFTVLDTIRKQVGANMIGLNLSSSLTNLIAPVQAMAKTNKLAVVKGTADTIKNIFIKDNFMGKNRFLTSRMGTDMISKNAWQKMQDAGFVFMKGMDWFSSNQIVRSKYYELRAKGMNEQQAHAEAGKFAARILGDRTKGANAQLYNSKIVGLVTQFQLEVNNQLYSQFYDTYHESKENAKGNALKTAAGMTFTLGQLFAFTHIFGQTFEAIAGYNPTFDVIEMIKTALGIGDDEDEEKTVSERLKKAADQLVDALPYVNYFTGGGRIPIASGVPNLIGFATGGKDDYGNEITLESELKKLLYLVPPTGGNQVKKTYQGLSMYDDKLPTPGSYTESGNLRFTVEDTPLNRIQSGLFGRWANEEADDYINSGFESINKNNIDELVDLGMKSSEYRKYRKGLSEAKAAAKDNKELSQAQAVFDYIESLNVSSKQKSIMLENQFNSSLDDEAEAKLNSLNMSTDEKISFYTSKSAISSLENDYKNEVEKLKDKYGEKSTTYKDEVEALSKERQKKVIEQVLNANLNDEQKTYLYTKYYSSEESLDKITSSGTSVDDYLNYKLDTIDYTSDEDEDGDTINGSLARKKINYLLSSNLSTNDIQTIYENDILSGFDDEKKYKPYKAVKAMGVDINSWLNYETQEFEADYNSKGNAIRNSKRNKVIKYVNNNLELTIPQKAAIIRTQYPSFDDYNKDIVSYVDSLDISYSEKIDILESLEMEINEDGTVRW